MTNSRNPLAVGVVVMLVLAGALYLLAHRGEASDDTGGGTLSSADRQALDAPPVIRGADSAGPNTSVDLREPVAVASAYVVAAYSLRDTDAGHTNRRAVPYAAPATAPWTVGTLVVSPPPPGAHSTATVTGVEQVSGEETNTRRGYIVRYRTSTEPSRHIADAPGTRYLLLIRQIDGRWLVAGDRTDEQIDGQVGEP